MKKTLIAFAALSAIAGMAQAQSTVTLYGVGDIHLGQSQTSTFSATGVETKLTQTVINSGGFNGSRWGVRGSEDLGGGLGAVFQLESGFDLSTGANTQGALFGRQAFIGVKGNFGLVSLGRQYSAYDALRGATNSVNDSSFAPTGSAWGAGIADYTNRIDNSVAYTSPDFSGVSGQIVYGLGENKTTSLDATRNISAHIKYANGPLVVGYAFQDENTRITPAAPLLASNSNGRKYNLFAGTYNFGVAALQAGYNNVKSGATKDREYMFGVSVPVGAANVYFGYAQSKSETGLVTTKGNGLGIAAMYDLSKRTALYAGYTNNKIEAGSATTAKTSLAAVGIRHRF